MMTGLIVTAARFERAATGHLSFVLIDVAGPRGGARELTISFDRHGALHAAIQTSPTVRYIAPADLDPAVRRAAESCYHREMKS